MVRRLLYFCINNTSRIIDVIRLVDNTALLPSLQHFFLPRAIVCICRKILIPLHKERNGYYEEMLEESNRMDSDRRIGCIDVGRDCRKCHLEWTRIGPRGLDPRGLCCVYRERFMNSATAFLPALLPSLDVLGRMNVYRSSPAYTSL